MKNLTPFETEVLKMFDETFKCIQNDCDGFGIVPDGGENPMQCQFHAEYLLPMRDFLLTQLRLARSDERKQAYEEGKLKNN